MPNICFKRNLLQPCLQGIKTIMDLTRNRQQAGANVGYLIRMHSVKFYNTVQNNFVPYAL